MKTHVDIIEYIFANHVRQNIEFQPPLPTLNDSAGLLWELSFNFNPPMQNWQGMMHTLHSVTTLGNHQYFFFQ